MSRLCRCVQPCSIAFLIRGAAPASTSAPAKFRRCANRSVARAYSSGPMKFRRYWMTESTVACSLRNPRQPALMSCKGEPRSTHDARRRPRESSRRAGVSKRCFFQPKTMSSPLCSFSTKRRTSAALCWPSPSKNADELATRFA